MTEEERRYNECIERIETYKTGRAVARAIVDGATGWEINPDAPPEVQFLFHFPMCLMPDEGDAT